MKIITIANMKGGVGKSLSTFNIAGILAEKGHKVLMIDIDPQANLSSTIGVDISDECIKGSKEIFNKNNSYTPMQILIKNPIEELPNLDLIAGNMFLYVMEFRLFALQAREKFLKRYIEKYQDFFNQYDYILIDTNPSLGILNQNAMTASDSIISPTIADKNSVGGIRLLEALWEEMKEALEVDTKIDAAFITLYDSRNNREKDIIKEMLSHPDADDLRDKLLKTRIPKNIELAKANDMGLPINIYNKNCKGYRHYFKLVEDLFDKGVF